MSVQISALSPQTRAQARLGAIYQGWLTFRANKLAMLGLAILIGLVGMAIFAPWLAPKDPFAQNLAGRLQPPSAANWRPMPRPMFELPPVMTATLPSSAPMDSSAPGQAGVRVTGPASRHPPADRRR